MRIKVKLDEGAKTPTRGHPGDAGLDIYSTETKWVHPGEYVCFGTGTHVAIPEGFVGLLTSKSGLMAKAGLTSRGTIDYGYTGEIKVVLFNHGTEGYLVNEGDKISQLVILPIITPNVEIVSDLDDSERGDNGFGSTGK